MPPNHVPPLPDFLPGQVFSLMSEHRDDGPWRGISRDNAMRCDAMGGKHGVFRFRHKGPRFASLSNGMHVLYCFTDCIVYAEI